MPANSVRATAAPLHLSQKFFWFATSLCLFAATGVICWQVIRGHFAAIEVHGIRYTSEEAEHSLFEARDRLLAMRTILSGAFERNDIEAVSETIPDFDEVLKSLGVAESALKRQQAHVQTVGDYGYNDYPNYGTKTKYGYDWGYFFSDQPPPPKSSVPREKP